LAKCSTGMHQLVDIFSRLAFSMGMHLARHWTAFLKSYGLWILKKKYFDSKWLSNSFKFIYNTISSNKRCVVCSKSSHNPDVSKFEWQNCEEQSTNGNAMEYQIVLLVRLIFHVPLLQMLVHLNAVVLHQIIWKSWSLACLPTKLW
jgi:hypothetical protein